MATDELIGNVSEILTSFQNTIIAQKASIVNNIIDECAHATEYDELAEQIAVVNMRLKNCVTQVNLIDIGFCSEIEHRAWKLLSLISTGQIDNNNTSAFDLLALTNAFYAFKELRNAEADNPHLQEIIVERAMALMRVFKPYKLSLQNEES